jgi:predicted porin
MKHVTGILIFFILTSTQALAGPFLEGREGYNLATDQQEILLRVGYNFDVGAGVMLSNTYNMQRKEELKHNYNEIEGWYPLKVTDNLTFQPGGLVNDKSIGSSGAFYMDVNYRFAPWFNLTVRNRYNYNNYSSTDFNNECDSNDTYDIGNYWNFAVTDKLSYTFEHHYITHLNNFHSSNGKRYNWEITNTFKYQLNKNWLPYLDLRWLDRNSEPYHKEQTQIRVGARYSF